MANVFYGLNNLGLRDNGDADVTVGASTGATDIEVRINDAKNFTRESAARYLAAIGAYIEAHATFPVI